MYEQRVGSQEKSGSQGFGVHTQTTMAEILTCTGAKKHHRISGRCEDCGLTGSPAKQKQEAGASHSVPVEL